MTRRESVQDKRIVTVGAVLIASAAVLGMAGVTLEAVAAISAMRRRIADMEATPRELARRNWVRCAATVRAAGDAWRREAAAGLAPTRPAHDTAGV